MEMTDFFCIQMLAKKIEISHRTIVFTVFFLIFLYLLYSIRQILTIFFVALVLMSALNSVVSRLEKWRLPRALAILFIYLLVFGVLGFVIASLVPPLVEQTTVLVGRFPRYLENIGFHSLDQQSVANQFGQIGSLSANIVKLTVGVFNNVLSIFVLAVITFYLLMERKNLDRYLTFFFGADGEKKAQVFVDELEKKLGGWVRAQLVLMVIVGLMSFAGLTLLGIDFALPLALLAGLLELVPNVGPTLAAIPAVLAGVAISPVMGLAVFALYFLIQQLENNLIVPQVMAKGLGVNPLISLLSLVIGFQLAGVVGAILAIPVVLMLQVVYNQFLSSRGIPKI